MIRAARSWNPAAVAITGGTGVPIVLMSGGIPLIGLSSGSVSAAGAISGITALPRVYPAAYCYFPANALATAIAAGFYYCTFTTTTAGTAFLNTYSSGTATIPASPTPVTDGKGAFTGDVTEEFGYTVTIPGGSMGTRGGIRISQLDEYTANANTKSSRIRFSGNAGTVLVLTNDTTNGMSPRIVEIHNAGSASSQVVKCTSLTILPTLALGTTNTAVDTTLVLSMQRGTATDNLVFLPPTIEYLLSPS